MAAFIFASDLVEGTTEELILDGMEVIAEMRAEENGTTLEEELAILTEERAAYQREDLLTETLSEEGVKRAAIGRILQSSCPFPLDAAHLEEMVNDWIEEDKREGVE